MKDEKKKKNSKLKVALNIFLFFLAIVLVLYFSLKDNFKEVVDVIFTMNPIFIIIALLLMLGYRLLSGYSLYIIVTGNNFKYKLKDGIELAFITQFFNGITPFATGGQPAQLYFLKQKDIPVTKGTNIISQNFIVYQIALVLYGIFAILYNYFFNVFPNEGLIRNLVTVGFVINFLIVVGLFILSFGKRLNSFILNKGLTFLAKIKIIKKEEETREKMNNYIQSFYQNAMQLSKRKGQFFKAVLVNFIGLTCQYIVPLFLIYGIGLYNVINPFEVVAASAYVMIIGAYVPIPGGSGGLEYGYIHFFGNFLDKSPLMATMLLWRTVTYYIGMFAGGIVLFLNRRRELK